MSKLRTVKLSEMNAIKLGLRNDKLYFKDEADKVIAWKDKEIQRLENLCESYRIDCDNLAIREANAYKEIERNNKQLRHQKYKRCLSIADFCESQHDYFNAVGNGFWLVRGEIETRDKYRKKASDFWLKWHRRWLELAEKFKPNNNSTAQRAKDTNHV